MKDNTSKFSADQQRDANKPGQGGSRTGSNTGMGSDYDRQKQQGGRPGSETTRNPSDSERNR